MELAMSALLEALPIAAEWQAALATAVLGGESGIDAWADVTARDDRMRALLFRTLLQGDMAGQLFVRTIEAPETVELRALRTRPLPAFLRMRFDAAISAFLDREILTPTEFLFESEAALDRADASLQRSVEVLRERSRDALREAIESGSTLREYSEQIRQAQDDLGLAPSSPHYLETVFRTTVQSAYGAGRYRQIRSEVVQSARPYVEYRTVQDSRVRDSHAALDGVIFAQDDPGWPRFAPPNGFNCRCSVVTLRESQVDESRLRTAAELHDEASPDDGFDTPPLLDAPINTDE
jgi:SPP1 gp7 family putative phage head morphogenesis protein